MKRTTIVTVLTAVLAVSAGVPSASAGESAASILVRSINAERARAGRPPLRVHAELTSYAQRHSRQMAAENEIRHTPHPSRAVSAGTVVGENVGFEPDAATMHDAFMASPRHRANILDSDYSLVGVGVVEKDGWIYATEIFAGSPGIRRVAVPRKPAPAPAPSKVPAAAVDNARHAGAEMQTRILLSLSALDVKRQPPTPARRALP